MRRLALLLAFLLTMGVAAPVAAQNVIEEEIEDVLGQIEDLQGEMEIAALEENYWADQVNATSRKMNDILDDLYRAEAVLVDLGLSISGTEQAVEITVAEIGRKEAELASTQAEIQATHEKVVLQAVELYKRGGSQIEVAFDYESVQEAAVVVRYGTALIEETSKTIDALEALRSSEEQQIQLIEDQKDTLDGQLSRLEGAREDAIVQQSLVDEAQRRAEEELLNQKALLQTVKTEIAEFENELDVLEQEQGRLQELLAEALRASGQAPGQLFRPVPGPVSSSFGPRLHPILGYTRLHTGVDMSARSGDEIAAAAGGTVILAGWYGGYGNTVILDHGGGMATLYAHQTEVNVSKGDEVGVADVVGYIGSTGLSTGPHLHFEVRLDGAPVDPVPYFSS